MITVFPGLGKLAWLNNQKGNLEMNVVETSNNQLSHKAILSSKRASKLSAGKLLSTRQREILVYRGAGWFVNEIAQTLGISQQTVKNHMAAVYQKLRCDCVMQAVLEAIVCEEISLKELIAKRKDPIPAHLHFYERVVASQ